MFADDGTNSYWLTESGDKSQWLSIVLKEQYNLRKIRMKQTQNKEYRPKAIEIEFADGLTKSSRLDNREGWLTIKLNRRVHTTSIKINIKSIWVSNSYYTGIAEIQAIGCITRPSEGNLCLVPFHHMLILSIGHAL